MNEIYLIVAIIAGVFSVAGAISGGMLTYGKLCYALGAFKQAVGDLTKTVDDLRGWLCEVRDKHEEKLNDHAERIAKLEGARET